MFSEKLDAAITALGANNSQIAEASGFDRSNISRLRNGKRDISPKSRTTGNVIDGLYLYARDSHSLDKLCALIGISPDSSYDEIRLRLHAWFFDYFSPSSEKSHPPP